MKERRARPMRPSRRSRKRRDGSQRPCQMGGNWAALRIDKRWQRRMFRQTKTVFLPAPRRLKWRSEEVRPEGLLFFLIVARRMEMV